LPDVDAVREVILGAFSFIRHGSEAGLPLMEATTCLYGGGGLTDEFFEAIIQSSSLIIRPKKRHRVEPVQSPEIAIRS